MSRWNSWLSELQPELFVEIDPDLAREKGIAQNDWVTVWTARSQVEAKAMVTRRLLPMRVHGRTIHVVGFPYHFGPAGVVVGDVVNDLIGVMLDPNVHIHESKALTCNLCKGRKDSREDDILRREFDAMQVQVAQGGAVGREHSEGAEMRHDSAARRDGPAPEQAGRRERAGW
jgi:predicted molibdopterin-dependent oxidoreductase YjgC